MGRWRFFYMDGLIFIGPYLYTFRVLYLPQADGDMDIQASANISYHPEVVQALDQAAAQAGLLPESMHRWSRIYSLCG